MESVDGAQVTTQATRPADPWEFLGRMTAELDWCRSAKNLEGTVMRLAPEQARGMVNGYLGYALGQGEHFAAYEITQAGWKRFIITDLDLKVRQALEGIVSQALPTKTREDSPDGEHFLRAQRIVQHLIKTKYHGVLDVARAAEENNPDLALSIYQSQNASSDVERVALAVFDKDPELALGAISDADKRIALIKRILDKEQPTTEEYAIAFRALNKTQVRGDPKEELYRRIAEATLDTYPMLAFEAAKETHGTKLLEKAKFNLIRKLGDEHTLSVKEALKGLGLPLDRDPEALRELAKAKYEGAKKKGSWWDYKEALEAFRDAQHEGPETEDCVLHLLLDDQVQRDHMPYISCEELITAGLKVVDDDPEKAYSLLEGQRKDPRVRQVMAKLSEMLEAKGQTESAYMAEFYTDAPRYDRVERLIMKLIQNEKETIPLCFHQANDTGAMISWYAKHSPRMKLGDRYNAALEISNLVEDDCLVQPLRERLIRQGVKEARQAFHCRNDTTGMAMLKEYIAQQAPGLAEHEELMIDILGLRTSKEEEQREQRRN